MKRLDQILVEMGLAPTRSKAQQMIQAGEVEIFDRNEWRSVHRPAHGVDERRSDRIRLKAGARTLKYVSRGGLKLESALDHLKLDVTGWNCLDVGQSTGGFTDALLRHGARQVAGFDVGHDQLHPSLRKDPRVVALEGLHVRDLQIHSRLLELIQGGLDLTVVDVSFISLTQVLPVLAKVFPPGGRILALVKPQFEVGPEGVGKGGLVTDEKLFDDVRSRVLLALGKCGFTERDYFPCAVRGQDGNQEFFVYAVRNEPFHSERLSD
jgi:23S rRNA (cytidine1920-2'-O)/16S rRNA (cytidine1409-2'-O)-methyltransferase